MGLEDKENLVAAKLPDEELRLFMTQGGRGTRSVIAELDAPELQVEFEERCSELGLPRLVPRRVAPMSHSEEKEVARRMAAAKAFLHETLDTPPVVLLSSRAFVLKVSSQQLYDVAASGLIRTVRLNRRHS